MEIQALLDQGAAAWNAGDLDAFVATYAVESTGIFTLVLRRDGDEWKMIHDHTSR